MEFADYSAGMAEKEKKPGFFHRRKKNERDISQSKHTEIYGQASWEGEDPADFESAPDRDRMDKVAEILDLPDNVEPFSIFVLGYPAEERKQQDRYDESRIHFAE